MKQVERKWGWGEKGYTGKKEQEEGRGEAKRRDGVREEERRRGGLLQRKGNRTVFWD